MRNKPQAPQILPYQPSPAPWTRENCTKSCLLSPDIQKIQNLSFLYLFPFSKLHCCSKVNDFDSLSTSFSQDNVFWLTDNHVKLKFQNISTNTLRSRWTMDLLCRYSKPLLTFGGNQFNTQRNRMKWKTQIYQIPMMRRALSRLT